MAYAANKRSDDIIYPGLIAAWSAKGKTNEDTDRAILKDLTGNGHDITLNNFAYSGMSGYGGYNTKFFNTKENTITANIQKNKLNVTNITGNGKFAYNWANGFSDIIYSSYKIQVKGLKDTMNLVYVYYNEKKERKEVNLIEDGIYQIPDGYGIKETGIIDFFGFDISNFTGECNLIIELLPEYPDALVFDGVDDWGISKSLPILTDYTIIVKRVFLDNEKGYSGTIAAKGVNPENLGAFCFERNDNTYYSQTSFGEGSRIKIDKNVEISWQTTLSYLGKAIHRGSLLDEPTFTIGTAFSRYLFLKGAIYSAYLFDRSLDDQEIKSFIRKYIDPEYLLPSEIPTPPPISAR